MPDYLENISIAVDEEIKILRARVVQREIDIAGLQKANETDETRINGLISAKVKLDEALTELASLPNWGVDSLTKDKPKAKVQRIPQKKVVFDLLEKAPNGLTANEMLKQAKEVHDVTLKISSLRAFLHLIVRDGVISSKLEKGENRYSLKRTTET